MRIELAQHAFQRAVDELIGLHRRDVASLDLVHRVFKQAQVGAAHRRVGGQRVAAAGGKRDREKSAASESAELECPESGAPAEVWRQWGVWRGHSSRSGWRFG